jgi:cobalt-zinc-cadmium efflux system membrane fusion protein
VSGVIVQSHFTLGDLVRRGQRLLDVRSSELSELQSELTIAERHLNSTQLLFDNGISSERELIEARAEFEKLQADIKLHGESRGNGIFSIIAPISGYVIEGERSTGSTFSEEDDYPLFVIADLSTVWVMANVHASDLPFVREGMAVEITTLSYPGRVFRGTINALSRVFDPEERVLRARIVMNNSDLALIPEMFVLATVKDESAQYFSAIPSDAIIFSDNQHFVVVEESRGNFAIRNVTLQGHNNNISYIAYGLSEGENVVTQNQLLIFSELRQR